MTRFLNIIYSFILITIFLVPMIFIFFVVKITSKGPGIHLSKRIGRHGKVFLMPKFRTMQINSPAVATHLLKKPTHYVTSVGNVLRRTSLDELPQLFSVLKGDMGFIGPRPALFNQVDLIALRSEKGVDNLLPGITGWAQVNGRDELSISQKVKFDEEYLNHKTFWFDIKILWLTFLKVGRRQGVIH